MKSAISAALIALLLGASLGQNFPECTQDLMQTDDCAAVIDPVACYNEFRWSTRTLQCIDGTDDADRKRKACKCCSCVGQVMCNWVKQSRYCSS